MGNANASPKQIEIQIGDRFDGEILHEEIKENIMDRRVLSVKSFDSDILYKSTKIKTYDIITHDGEHDEDQQSDSERLTSSKKTNTVKTGKNDMEGQYDNNNKLTIEGGAFV